MREISKPVEGLILIMGVAIVVMFIVIIDLRIDMNDVIEDLNTLSEINMDTTSSGKEE